MCYSGSCPYEYLKADQYCGCRKPQGEPCPHELEDDYSGDFETEDDYSGDFETEDD